MRKRWKRSSNPAGFQLIQWKEKEFFFVIFFLNICNNFSKKVLKRYIAYFLLMQKCTLKSTNPSKFHSNYIYFYIFMYQLWSVPIPSERLYLSIFISNTSSIYLNLYVSTYLSIYSVPLLYMYGILLFWENNSILVSSSPNSQGSCHH